MSTDLSYESHPNAVITKITHELTRGDGSQVRIVVQQFFGLDMTQPPYIDIYVLQRPDQVAPWRVLNDRPHPDWRSMSVDDYIKRGRSELLQTVSFGEIMRLTFLIGKPIAVLSSTSNESANRSTPRYTASRLLVMSNARHEMEVCAHA